jgi:hypothetical protein
VNPAELCARILSAAPEAIRLTTEEQLLLEAYLRTKRPTVSLSRLQRDPAYRNQVESQRAERQHLAFVLTFNKSLDSAGLPPETVEADRSTAGPRHTFPAPPGVRWSDIQMRFTDGHTLRIRIGGATRLVTCEQLDLHDRRTMRPNLQWDLLKTFAEGRGKLNWDDRSASRRHQKRKEELAKALRGYFGIDDDPFVTEGGGWRTKFSIEGDS